MTGFWNGLADFLYPRACAICGRLVDRPGRYVCSSCHMRLPFVPTTGCCRVCGRDVPVLDRAFVCEQCRTVPPHFDRACSVLRFEDVARRLLLDFKFDRHLWLRNDFVDWMEAVARDSFDLSKVLCVLPMPATLRHRLLRGYNPCHFLAKALAGRIGVPFSGCSLRRTGHPARQGGLTEEERRKNVRGTFAVTSRARRDLSTLPKEAAVLVVDDVMTTGSTLSECARTLKKVCPSNVWCLTLARTSRG